MRNLLIACLLAGGPAAAAELGGVTLPDTTTLGEHTLVLNGAGLREFLFIDIYVGGLYLPTKTTDAAKVLAEDGPKKVVMHFTFRKVPQSRMVDTFRDGFAAQGTGPELADRLSRLEAMMDSDVYAGDVIVLDYLPDRGLTVTANGKSKGTIEGADFMRAVMGVFIGDKPASKALKDGMLGG